MGGFIKIGNGIEGYYERGRKDMEGINLAITSYFIEAIVKSKDGRNGDKR